ncbi:MAG: O-acetyl-ADP-ribose deacetylase [Spirochaetia bacterium]|nr:O-acetyl-ADP-ribose deacetylase [Spirochaetia bacterium]
MKYLTDDRIAIEIGDLTKLDVTAVVNAANSGLLGGGGVDGAIHRAGGTEILAECIKIRETIYPNGMPAGNAVVTTAGKMKAEYVIHTVGPVWHGGNSNEPEILRNAYINSLKAAAEKKMESVAFPAISTGVYRFPKNKAARIAFSAAREFAAKSEYPKKIIFVFFSESDRETFIRAIKQD